MQLRFLLPGSRMAVGFGITLGFGVAMARPPQPIAPDPPECEQLTSEWAKRQSMVDAKLANSPDLEIANIVTEMEAIQTKIRASCVSAKQYEQEKQIAWTNKTRERRQAANQCLPLKNLNFKKRTETSKAIWGEKPIERDARDNAIDCIRTLAAYGSSLSPSLSACLSDCVRVLGQLAPAQDPACGHALKEGSVFLGEAEKLLASHKPQDVLIDFNAEKQKLHHAVDDSARRCVAADNVEFAGHEQRLEDHARAIDSYAKARSAYDSFKNDAKTWPKLRSTASRCLTDAFGARDFDKQMSSYAAECQTWRKQAMSAPKAHW